MLWVKCCDRLPDRNTNYIVVRHIKSIDYYYVGIGHFNYNYNNKWDSIDVVAWMEIPEFDHVFKVVENTAQGLKIFD